VEAGRSLNTVVNFCWSTQRHVPSRSKSVRLRSRLSGRSPHMSIPLIWLRAGVRSPLHPVSWNINALPYNYNMFFCLLYVYKLLATSDCLLVHTVTLLKTIQSCCLNFSKVLFFLTHFSFPYKMLNTFTN
jgi:hypothetical protein